MSNTENQTQQPAIYDADELAELDRFLTKAKRHSASDLTTLKDKAAAALKQQASIASNDEMALLAAQFETARAVHRYIHAGPYTDDMSKRRSLQWQSVKARYTDLDDGELMDWLDEQIEVALNREQGVQDLRPRKDGPSFLILLEFVANRKRKSLAILHWAKDAEASGLLRADGDTLDGKLRALHAAASAKSSGREY